MHDHATFRSLEPHGFAARDESQPLSALDSWYESVGDTPIAQLRIRDVCRACRQELYLKRVIPAALVRLGRDPLAGELYDGELIVALAGVPRDYWAAHRDQTRSLRGLLAGVVAPDADVAAAVQRLQGQI